MEQTRDFLQLEMFSNRLAKRYRHLRKWARREGISCFRVYDRDIPEVPLAVDVFEFTQGAAGGKNFSAFCQDASRRHAVMFLYERPYEKQADKEEAWLSLMAGGAAKVFGIEKNRVIIKTRRHEKGGGQYASAQASSPSQIAGVVTERGELFKVDLTSRIDTGLFLDHRPLRKTVREISKSKRVLNLFCYTASFSVYAASGGAAFVESVDLSNTYLDWAKENMKMNGHDAPGKFIYTRADVVEFLQRRAAAPARQYDVIILDPPTFSNSKMARNIIDTNRDWSFLVNGAMKLLSPSGVLFFSTNSRRLKFEASLIKNAAATEITEATIDEDFKNKRPHKVWKITK